MRVYLPSTLTGLAEVLKSGEIGPAPQPGFAVTPALRESYSSGDLEELEYPALLEAARGSLRLLAEQPDAPPRRVVLAAEVAEDDLGKASGHPAAIQVLSAIPLSHVAAGHVDSLDATDDVRAAFMSLVPFLKPGGEIVIDVYHRHTGLFPPLKYWARPFLTWMGPKGVHKFF